MKNFFSTTEELVELIRDRKIKKPKGSYTAELFKKRTYRIAKKVGEEAVEVALAAQLKDKKEFVYEIADLWYHLLVLMESKKTTLDEVARELKNRYQ